jgi:hypothetical protein
VGRHLGPVDADSLNGLRVAGATSAILQMRLDYMERAHLLNHYIGPAAGRPMATKGRLPWVRLDGRVCECGHRREDHA